MPRILRLVINAIGSQLIIAILMRAARATSYGGIIYSAGLLAANATAAS